MPNRENSNFEFSVTMNSFNQDDTTIDIFEDTHDTPNLGDLSALFIADESHSSFSTVRDQVYETF